MGILLNVCDDLSPELFKPLFTHIEVLFSLKMFPLVKTFQPAHDNSDIFRTLKRGLCDFSLSYLCCECVACKLAWFYQSTTILKMIYWHCAFFFNFFFGIFNKFPLKDWLLWKIANWDGGGVKQKNWYFWRITFWLKYVFFKYVLQSFVQCLILQILGHVNEIFTVPLFLSWHYLYQVKTCCENSCMSRNPLLLERSSISETNNVEKYLARHKRNVGNIIFPLIRVRPQIFDPL